MNVARILITAVFGSLIAYYVGTIFKLEPLGSNVGMESGLIR